MLGTKRLEIQSRPGRVSILFAIIFYDYFSFRHDTPFYRDLVFIKHLSHLLAHSRALKALSRIPNEGTITISFRQILQVVN